MGLELYFRLIWYFNPTTGIRLLVGFMPVLNKVWTPGRMFLWWTHVQYRVADTQVACRPVSFVLGLHMLSRIQTRIMAAVWSGNVQILQVHTNNSEMLYTDH
jgi:hypothetical protein